MYDGPVGGTHRQMDTSSTYVAIRLLAQAKVEHEKGSLAAAIELLNGVIALGAQDEDFRSHYPYLAAHINLYRIYHYLGRDKEARDYYAKALALGATSREIWEY